MLNSLEKYALLIVRTGLNLQPNQTLVIFSPIECAPFTRLVAQTAYQEGARDVVIQWRDELFSKIRYLGGPEEIFAEFPDWQRDFYLTYVRQGAAFLTISASDPELMRNVKPERIMNAQKASSTALKEYRDRLMSNQNVWSVVSIPTEAWAKKVFPSLPSNEAINKLWETIFMTVRVNTEDPIKSWNEHKNNLKKEWTF